MRCLTGVFISPRVFHFTSRFSSRFSSRFRYQHVGIQNARENARKTREKREKNKKCEPKAGQCFYITLCVGKKRESVVFWSRFGRVLVAFWSRFGRVLVAFWSQTLPKRKPNA